ncbi:MAG TPA: hypothetical protein VGV93_05895 [Acidimicrobiales bacterium]|nr:hypothetical protein [Acidimicrobiales bacterium]
MVIDGFDGAALLAASLSALVPAGVFLWWGFRPLGRRVDAWAAARGVPLTEQTRPFVTAHLQRARRWRTVGFTLGWLTPYLLVWVTRSAYDQPAMNPLAVTAGGYLVGALGAELWATRRNRPSGAAVIASRDLDCYVPARAMIWVRGAAAAAAVLAVFNYAVPGKVAGNTAPEPLLLARTVLVALVLVVAAEVLPRLAIRRRQPFVSAELLRADDAVRSWSAHAMTGVLLALLLLTVAGQLFSLGRVMESTVSRWAFYLLGLAIVAVAIGAFQHLSDYCWRWQVRRGELEEVGP